MIWLAGSKCMYIFGKLNVCWDRRGQYFPSLCHRIHYSSRWHRHMENTAHETKKNEIHSVLDVPQCTYYTQMCVFKCRKIADDRRQFHISLSVLVCRWLWLCVCLLFYSNCTFRFALWNTSYASVKYEYSMQRRIINLFSIFQ